MALNYGSARATPPPMAVCVRSAKLGGTKVPEVARVGYHASHTYDILPRSNSGHYIAGGALIGSTLRGGQNVVSQR
jgi:hypothetical protein